MMDRGERHGQTLRWLQWSLGCAWAIAMLWAGLWLWRQGILGSLTAAGALFFIAAGQFVFMVLVADDLCPQAHAAITGFGKAFAGALTWLALGYAVLRAAALW
jgi:hypothetical protein